jgi:hypothetical protein
MKRLSIATRRTASVFIVALITASSPVALARTYLGSGGTTCAEYIAIKQALPDIGRAIDLWLLGYVSGLNFYAYANKQVDLLGNQSAHNVISFVQGYCAINGDKTLNNAANEYWIQISNRFAR